MRKRKYRKLSDKCLRYKKASRWISDSLFIKKLLTLISLSSDAEVHHNLSSSKELQHRR